MASYTLPQGWESDYDGATEKWFFVHRPSGVTQFLFPKPGDELKKAEEPVEMAQPQPKQLTTDVLAGKIDAMAISLEQQRGSPAPNPAAVPHQAQYASQPQAPAYPNQMAPQMVHQFQGQQSIQGTQVLGSPHAVVSQYPTPAPLNYQQQSYIQQPGPPPPQPLQVQYQTQQPGPPQQQQQQQHHEGQYQNQNQAPLQPAPLNIQPQTRPLSGIQQYPQASPKPQANQMIRRKPTGNSLTHSPVVSGHAIDPNSPSLQKPAYQVQQQNWNPQPLVGTSPGQSPGPAPGQQPQSAPPSDTRQSEPYQPQQLPQQHAHYQAYNPAPGNQGVQGGQVHIESQHQRQGSVGSQKQQFQPYQGQPTQSPQQENTQYQRPASIVNPQQQFQPYQDQPTQSPQQENAQLQRPASVVNPQQQFQAYQGQPTQSPQQENVHHQRSDSVVHEQQQPQVYQGQPLQQSQQSDVSQTFRPQSTGPPVQGHGNISQLQANHQPQNETPNGPPTPATQVPQAGQARQPQGPPPTHLQGYQGSPGQQPHTQQQNIALQGLQVHATSQSPAQTQTQTQTLPSQPQGPPSANVQPYQTPPGQVHPHQANIVPQGQPPAVQIPTQPIQDNRRFSTIPGPPPVNNYSPVSTPSPNHQPHLPPPPPLSSTQQTIPSQQPQYVQGVPSTQLPQQFVPPPPQNVQLLPQSPNVATPSHLQGPQGSHLYRAQSGPASSTFAQLVERDTLMAPTSLQMQPQYVQQNQVAPNQQPYQQVQPGQYQPGTIPQPNQQYITTQFQQPPQAYNPAALGALTSPAGPDPNRIQPYQAQFAGPPPNPNSLPPIGSTRPGLMARWSTSALTNSKKGLEKSKDWMKKNPMGTVAMVGGLGVVAEACGVPVLNDARMAGRVYNTVQANKAKQERMQAQAAGGVGKQPAEQAGMSQAAMQAAIQQGIQDGIKAAMLAQNQGQSGQGQVPMQGQAGRGRGVPVQPGQQVQGGRGRGIPVQPGQNPQLMHQQVLQQQNLQPGQINHNLQGQPQPQNPLTPQQQQQHTQNQVQTNLNLVTQALPLLSQQQNQPQGQQNFVQHQQPQQDVQYRPIQQQHQQQQQQQSQTQANLDLVAQVLPLLPQQGQPQGQQNFVQHQQQPQPNIQYLPQQPQQPQVLYVQAPPPPTVIEIPSQPQYVQQDPSLLTQIIQSQLQPQPGVQFVNTGLPPPPPVTVVETTRYIDVGSSNSGPVQDGSRGLDFDGGSDRSLSGGGSGGGGGGGGGQSLAALQVQQSLQLQGEANALSLIDDTQYKVNSNGDVVSSNGGWQADYGGDATAARLDMQAHGEANAMSLIDDTEYEVTYSDDGTMGLI